MQIKHIPLIVGLCAALSACSQEAQQPNPLIVATDKGKVEGSVIDNGVQRFLGIPYAADTSGANRWQPPQPTIAWTDVKPAQAFGDICSQPIPVNFGPWTEEFHAKGTISENCLSLNVWTPDTQAKNLPVFVWIHGGGFSTGSSDVPIYQGYSLAKEGIVVVSMNYRLGILGFLASSALQSENGHAGEYGMLDQVAALQWVKNNIAAFGGDPNNVTIGGQSAGSAAVQNLMKSPLADGLYHKAAIQSGIGLGALTVNLEATIEQGDQFIASTGAGSIDELRQKDPNELITMAGKFKMPGATRPPRFSPPSGNSFGLNFRHSDIPVITGLTAHENSTFRRMTELDEAGYETFMQTTFGDMAEQFKALYANDGLDYLATAQAVMRDKGIASMAFRLEMADSPTTAYSYLFTQMPPGEPQGFMSFHSAELPYMFGTLQEGVRPYSDQDRALSEVMVKAWANFMKDPASLLNSWPKYDAEQRRMMVFGGDALNQVTEVMAPEKLALYRQFKEQGGSVGMLSL